MNPSALVQHNPLVNWLVICNQAQPLDDALAKLCVPPTLVAPSQPTSKETPDVVGNRLPPLSAMVPLERSATHLVNEYELVSLVKDSPVTVQVVASLVHLDNLNLARKLNAGLLS
ncbi:MAG: hypothetical protein WCS99_21320 [Limisphaerales bacterium]